MKFIASIFWNLFNTPVTKDYQTRWTLPEPWNTCWNVIAFMAKLALIGIGLLIWISIYAIYRGW